jgi:hypothetical protein
MLMADGRMSGMPPTSIFHPNPLSLLLLLLFLVLLLPPCYCYCPHCTCCAIPAASSYPVSRETKMADGSMSGVPGSVELLNAKVISTQVGTMLLLVLLC